MKLLLLILTLSLAGLYAETFIVSDGKHCTIVDVDKDKNGNVIGSTTINGPCSLKQGTYYFALVLKPNLGNGGATGSSAGSGLGSTGFAIRDTNSQPLPTTSPLFQFVYQHREAMTSKFKTPSRAQRETVAAGPLSEILLQQLSKSPAYQLVLPEEAVPATNRRAVFNGTIFNPMCPPPNKLEGGYCVDAANFSRK